MPGQEADYYVIAADDSLAPYFRRGARVPMQRDAPLRDGDVGLFYIGARGLVFRQYCRDYAGNGYLLVLDRRRAALDLRLPAGDGAPLCCFGRVLLPRDHPLPAD